MLRRINFIIFTILVVVLVSFLFMYNQTPITVTYAPKQTLTAQTALILTYTFGLGVIVAAIVSLFMGARVRFLNRSLARQLRTKQEHLALIEDARGHLALGDYQSAQAACAKIIQREPENIVARIELAETHRRQGDRLAALKVLDQSRVEQKKNVELLLLAADINSELGNHTAAFDNAALILQLKPRNLFALERVIAACVQLGRIDDAIAHQNELVRSVTGETYQFALLRLAELDLRRAVRESGSNTKALKTALEKVLRGHHDFPPALALLAEVELEDGNVDAAVKLWKKHFALTASTSSLESMAIAWLTRNRPAQAVGSVRSALDTLKDRSSQQYVEAQLFLIQLLMHLEMLDEAEGELARLPANAGERQATKGAYAVLRAQLLRKKDRSDEAINLLSDQAVRDSSLLSSRLSDRSRESVTSTDWTERLERSLVDPLSGVLSVAA